MQTKNKWVVQSRKHKGRYENRITTDNAVQAHFYYRCINIGAPYTKRLLCNGTVIHRSVGI